MNKIKKGLLSLVLPSIFAVSGCSGLNLTGTMGGFQPTDLSSSRYVSAIEKKADELAKSTKLENKKEAIKAYGSIKKLDEMDKIIESIINENLDEGLTYAEFGEKYHQLHNK